MYHLKFEVERDFSPKPRSRPSLLNIVFFSIGKVNDTERLSNDLYKLRTCARAKRHFHRVSTIRRTTGNSVICPLPLGC